MVIGKWNGLRAGTVRLKESKDSGFEVRGLETQRVGEIGEAGGRGHVPHPGTRAGARVEELWWSSTRSGLDPDLKPPGPGPDPDLKPARVGTRVVKSGHVCHFGCHHCDGDARSWRVRTNDSGS